MKVRLLPAGDQALLLEVAAEDGVDAVLALTAALRDADLAGVIDLVPAARTVLVQGATGVDVTALSSAVRRVAGRADVTATGAVADHELVIPVRYDGPDLAEVARLIGSSPAEVITRHTGTIWRAAFIGFAPGFAYLTGSGQWPAVPRRAESRTTVPAGSVALAGDYSAVYPRASPGGWQLIGSTDAVLWDVERDPPAEIRPGSRVRFVDVAESAGPATGPGDRS